MSVVGLVAKPTADQEIRESVIRILRRTLEEAEAGEVASLVLIVGNVRGEWVNRQSDTNKLSETIGQLEIAKQERIAQYLTKE